MKYILYIDWFQHKDKKRDDEFSECIVRNEQVFDHVNNITGLKERPTFNDIFSRISEMTKHAPYKNEKLIHVIANLDIFFDETIKLLTPKENECFALTRWNIIGNNAHFFNRPDSQDAWIFRNPPLHIKGADFGLGIPGCDNAIAERLTRAGYTVSNPSKTIRAYHLHASSERQYIKDRVKPVPPPYLQIHPTA